MELAMGNGFSAVGFTELNEQEMIWVDGGGVLGSTLIGAGIGAVGCVLLTASCMPLTAPVVILGVTVKAGVAAGIGGGVFGAIGGAIKGALN